MIKAILNTMMTLSALAAAQTAMASTLKVRVTGATTAKGQIFVCVFREGQGFPDCLKNKPTAKTSVAAGPGVEVVFDAIAPGDYAVSAFHDENGNGRIDTNFIGIPRESLGVSNNPKLGMGAPRFEVARVRVGDTTKISINLQRF